ncbi:hypothetical protein [Myxococcus sp. SDU36]|uniref:hypothetical protein n=1 Tax=Myxococcus sp. SDU36 TaxID=2831967 RepID=UPI002542EAED|nr:hypothetical protein [Myxococcus sp. SDU36]WIG98353.1 nucleotide-binding protein [Myxococcus sp. SDU36]
MDDGSRVFTLFYSWQSDIVPDSHGRKVIRDSLRNAMSDVESKISGVRLELDEATRGKVGSPEIPNTLFEKIERADVFVADVTIVNSGTSDERKMPNPNVMVELGYAAGRHGWGRVIMIANTAHGRLEELPFDIRQKVVSKFRCQPPSGDMKKDKGEVSNALGSLSMALSLAVEGILRALPERPVIAAVDEAAVRRRRDLKVLREMFLRLNPDVIDGFVESAPNFIDSHVMTFWEDFDSHWQASATHLYDERARGLMERVHESWGGAMSHGENYQMLPSGGYSWVMPTQRDAASYVVVQNDFRAAKEDVRALRGAYSELLGHLRSSYVELDLDVLKVDSWRMYREFMISIKSKFESEK